MNPGEQPARVIQVAHARFGRLSWDLPTRYGNFSDAAKSMKVRKKQLDNQNVL